MLKYEWQKRGEYIDEFDKCEASPDLGIIVHQNNCLKGCKMAEVATNSGLGPVITGR